MLGPIVVIDDNPIVLELLSFFLEEEGYTVAIADCGREGLNQALELAAPVVICDIKLPDLSGLDVLNAIRQACQPSPPMLIAITAEPAFEAITITAGADACLVKPFEPDRLLGLLRERLLVPAHV